MDRPIRVLVVDDEPAFAALVADALPREDDRLTVETVTSAREGLDRLALPTVDDEPNTDPDIDIDIDIDCVVSDYDMPGMDGLELLRVVRELAPELPFLLCSGTASETVATEALAAGVTDYVPKHQGHSQTALLANRITNAVERVRAERARDRDDSLALKAELERLRARYDSLFENTPLVIWEEDFSETKAALDEIRERVDSVEAYLLAHPDELRRIVETIDVIGVNQNAVRYYGAESKADLLDNLDQLFTDEARDVIAAEFAAIARGDRRFRADTVYRSFDGERRDEMLDLYVPDTAADDYSRVYLTGTDITTRKQHERALRRERDRLDEFASFVSHDLRSPLTVAAGHLHLAREECESDSLVAVERALDRMDQLVTDLLSLAREGESVGETAPVDLVALVERCWVTVETADARLEVVDAPTVMADRSRLATLVENLLRNAIEHAGDEVTITLGGLADESGFYVADDGPGIPPEARASVFESGYSTTDDGTGFGLAIVEQIVDAHGWEITATEQPGGGARFEVTGVDTETDVDATSDPADRTTS